MQADDELLDVLGHVAALSVPDPELLVVGRLVLSVRLVRQVVVNVRLGMGNFGEIA